MDGEEIVKPRDVSEKIYIMRKYVFVRLGASQIETTTYILAILVVVFIIHKQVTFSRVVGIEKASNCLRNE